MQANGSVAHSPRNIRNWRVVVARSEPAAIVRTLAQSAFRIGRIRFNQRGSSKPQINAPARFYPASHDA